MRRVLLYDNGTVKSDYAAAVCREILMRDELILRVVCGCRDENEWTIFSKLGFVCTEKQMREEENCPDMPRTQEYVKQVLSESTLAAEIIKAAREEIIGGIDIVTTDATVEAAIREARMRGKEMRVFVTPHDSTNAGQKSIRQASFIRQCDRFSYLEILRGEFPVDCLTPLEEIIADSYHIIIEERERNGAVKLQDLHAALLRLHPEYDARNYGYAGLLELLAKKTPNIRTYREDGCTYLEYVDDREQVERFITNYLTKRDNKVEDMQELLDALAEEFERFDTRLYGYTSDIAFFLSFPKLEIYNNKGVKLKQVFKLK